MSPSSQPGAQRVCRSCCLRSEHVAISTLALLSLKVTVGPGVSALYSPAALSSTTYQDTGTYTSPSIPWIFLIYLAVASLIANSKQRYSKQTDATTQSSAQRRPEHSSDHRSQRNAIRQRLGDSDVNFVRTYMSRTLRITWTRFTLVCVSSLHATQRVALLASLLGDRIEEYGRGVAHHAFHPKNNRRAGNFWHTITQPSITTYTQTWNISTYNKNGLSQDLGMRNICINCIYCKYNNDHAEQICLFSFLRTR